MAGPGGPVPPPDAARLHSGSVHSGPAVPPADPPRTEDAGGKKRPRKPLLVGLAVLAVLFMVIGSGATYMVMDRLGDTTVEPGGVDDAAADASSPEPSPTSSPSPTPTPTEEPTGEPAGEPSDDPSEDPSADPTEGVEDGETMLTRMEPVDNDSWDPSAERVEIDGEVYNRALFSEDCGAHMSCAGWAEYNLSRNWDTFTTSVGITDESASGETATFSVQVDGETVATESTALGELVEIEVDVSDALRMRVEVETDNSDVFPAWTDPTLLQD
ncbi:NPCBM/NEW2 domain-containing protein [Nocardiopsis salina]|uniref:NPCBM/NEW2 domain-containing protein n=1 Tax=Nocardiopsis salina TaxID=245836 RepID=UPI000349ACB7|nr:NPCBM/NEW2 domain-containing protein [Nocardiopsis salina]